MGDDESDRREDRDEVEFERERADEVDWTGGRDQPKMASKAEEYEGIEIGDAVVASAAGGGGEIDDSALASRVWPLSEPMSDAASPGSSNGTSPSPTSSISLAWRTTSSIRRLRPPDCTPSPPPGKRYRLLAHGRNRHGHVSACPLPSLRTSRSYSARNFCPAGFVHPPSPLDGGSKTTPRPQVTHCTRSRIAGVCCQPCRAQARDERDGGFEGEKVVRR